MIYNYTDLKEKGLNDRKIRKMLDSNELYHIERGIYSDKEHYDRLELIVKKYPNAVFTSESAYYYLGLTDYIPKYYFLATKNSIRKIENDKIIQSFVSNNFFEIGKEEILYSNIKISIYNKERMLIELIKNRNNLAYDYYKEIIINYRKISHDLDLSKINKYLKKLANGDKIFEIIHKEVF